MNHPPCFPTQQHFDGWMLLARMAKTTMVENVHCIDCLPEFKSRMRAQGRCSNPNYQFPKEASE